MIEGDCLPTWLMVHHECHWSALVIVIMTIVLISAKERADHQQPVGQS